MEIDSEIKVEKEVSDMPVKAKAKPPCSPVKSTNPSTNTKPKPKLKVKMKVPSIKKEPIQQTPAIPVLVGGSLNQLRVTGISTFMGTTWSSTFLPTLYNIFGHSRHPFTHFSKGLKVVQNIQDAIDLAWPGTNYKVQWSDTACSKVSRYS